MGDNRYISKLCEGNVQLAFTDDMILKYLDGHHLLLALVCKDWRDLLKNTDNDMITYISVACQSVALLEYLQPPKLHCGVFKSILRVKNMQVLSYAIDSNYSIDKTACAQIVSLGDIELTKRVVSVDNFTDQAVIAAIESKDSISLTWMIQNYRTRILQPTLCQIVKYFAINNELKTLADLSVSLNSGLHEAFMETKSRKILGLITEHNILPNDEVVKNAIAKGRVSFMKHVLNKYKMNNSHFEFHAARLGQVSSLQFLHNNGIYFHSKTWIPAIRNGHCDVVKWGIDHGYNMTEVDLIYAVDAGIEMVKLIVDNLDLAKGTEICYFNATVEMAEYIHASGYPCKWTTLIEAITRDNYELQDWIVARYPNYPYHRLVPAAAERGNIKYVQMFSTPGDLVSHETIMASIASGNLKLVKWLVVDCNVRLSDRHLTFAAQKDHLHILQWYHKRCGVKPESTRSVHERIEKWLSEPRCISNLLIF